MSKKRGVYLTCHICQKEYYVQQHRSKISKYCSLRCMNFGQHPIIIKTCINCKNEFRVPNSKSRQKFCTMECRHSNQMTFREHRRKQHALNRLKRGNTARRYRKIAFMFKERKCEICGYNEYDFCLDVHHIDKDPENNAIENLAVLCCICHRKLHKNVIELK